MARSVTLFTGQWADLPFDQICAKAKSFGYDGFFEFGERGVDMVVPGGEVVIVAELNIENCMVVNNGTGLLAAAISGNGTGTIRVSNSTITNNQRGVFVAVGGNILSRGNNTLEGMKEDEAAIYDFCVQLHRNRKVDDTAFNRVKALFGEQGVMDLVIVSGYYVAVSMTLNVAQVPVPDGSVPLKPVD